MDELNDAEVVFISMMLGVCEDEAERDEHAAVYDSLKQKIDDEIAKRGLRR